ncbi:MAG: hypothetical protein BWY59_00128 [Verrucomicrobia bacterium ADurb.Bin345]|nr:MAG: hypothetical protein BWY59_00128 [Verrucomicrobia bacterium ADurb.Bin345]
MDVVVRSAAEVGPRFAHRLPSRHILRFLAPGTQKLSARIQAGLVARPRFDTGAEPVAEVGPAVFAVCRLEDAPRRVDGVGLLQQDVAVVRGLDDDIFRARRRDRGSGDRHPVRAGIQDRRLLKTYAHVGDRAEMAVRDRDRVSAGVGARQRRNHVVRERVALDRLAEARREHPYIALAGTSGPGDDDDLRGGLALDGRRAHAAQRHVRDVRAVAEVAAVDENRIPAGCGSVRRRRADLDRVRRPPLRDVLRGHPSGIGEQSARVQVDPVVCQREDLPVHSASEGGPGFARGIPFRDAICRDAAGVGEQAARVEMGSVMRQHVNIGIHTGAEIGPRPAFGIPFCDVPRGHLSGIGEQSARVQAGPVMRQCPYLVVHPAAEVGPGFARGIPSCRVLRALPSGEVEVAACVQAGPVAGQGVDPARNAGVEIAPGFSVRIPSCHAFRRYLTRVGEHAARVQAGSIVRQRKDTALRYPHAEIGPCGVRGIPFGHAVGFRLPGDTEIAARIQVRPVAHQRLNMTIHPVPEIGPGPVHGIPSRHAIRRRSARRREDPSGIEVRSVVRQRPDLAIHAGAEVGPNVRPVFHQADPSRRVYRVDARQRDVAVVRGLDHDVLRAGGIERGNRDGNPGRARTHDRRLHTAQPHVGDRADRAVGDGDRASACVRAGVGGEPVHAVRVRCVWSRMAGLAARL